MLDGEAKERWTLNVKMFTEHETVDRDGKTLEVQGKTADSFSKKKVVWIKSYFDSESLLVMQEYFCTQLKFPVHRNVLIKDLVNHLQQINGKLIRFPHQRNTKVDNVLSDQESKYIIFKATPLSWQTKLHLTGRNLYHYNIQALTEFFKVVQTDAKETRDKNNSKTKNNFKTQKMTIMVSLEKRKRNFVKTVNVTTPLIGLLIITTRINVKNVMEKS